MPQQHPAVSATYFRNQLRKLKYVCTVMDSLFRIWTLDSVLGNGPLCVTMFVQSLTLPRSTDVSWGLRRLRDAGYWFPLGRYTQMKRLQSHILLQPDSLCRVSATPIVLFYENGWEENCISSPYLTYFIL